MSRGSDEFDDSNEEQDRESESGTTTTFLSVEEVDAQIELVVDILPVDKQLRQEQFFNLPFFGGFFVLISIFCYFRVFRQLKKNVQKATNYAEVGLEVMQAIARFVEIFKSLN